MTNNGHAYLTSCVLDPFLLYLYGMVAILIVN